MLAFLESAEKGQPAQKDLTRTVKLEIRDGEKGMYTVTSRADGGWVHRNYLAK